MLWPAAISCNPVVLKIFTSTYFPFPHLPGRGLWRSGSTISKLPRLDRLPRRSSLETSVFVPLFTRPEQVHLLRRHLVREWKRSKGIKQVGGTRERRDA